MTAAKENDVAIVIPARLASTRLPGKPLLRKTGKFLIQHVWERATGLLPQDRIWVATDSREICEAVTSFGGQAALTRSDHPSGTDRIAELAPRIPGKFLLNIQGDEPDFPGEAVARLLADPPDAPLSTLAFASDDPGDYRSPHVVKVVLGKNGKALYFSRSPLPYYREPSTSSPFLKHLGIYLYRRDFILAWPRLRPTPLEQAEKLEQLRALESGHDIVVRLSSRDSLGIDTPEDYARFTAGLSHPQEP